MKNKKRNVAAGRLGDLSLAARSSQSEGRRRAGYSAERLGIVSDSESCEPETQELAVEPQDVPQAGAAEPSAHAWMPEQPLPAAEPERHSQPAEHFAPVPKAPWEDIPAAASSADDRASPAWPAGLRHWLPDGPRGGLAMAGAAACVMLVVLVLVWWFSDETMDPQQAAAAGGAQPGTLSSQARDPSARKPPRINVATGARPRRPRRRPLGLPKGRLAAAKPPPNGSARDVPQASRQHPPPSARTPTSRPRRTVATTSRPASAAPRPSKTTSTKPAAVPPGSGPPGPPPAIRVSCVMEGPSGPAAIINGNCVTVGDTVSGARIIAIGQFTIEVEYKGHKHFIGVSAPHSAAPAAADEEHDATEEAGEGSDETSDEQ